jgi:hypothetical protein
MRSLRRGRSDDSDFESDEELTNQFGSGSSALQTRALEGVRKLRRHIAESPDRIVAAYQEQVERYQGVTSEKQVWEFKASLWNYCRSSAGYVGCGGGTVTYRRRWRNFCSNAKRSRW